MKKICFIAQFPPPIHGLSKAVDTLYNSEISKEFQLEKVDIKNNKKIFKSLWLILKSKADLFYFTISQSKGGNLRDLVFLKLIELKHKKCLVHLHGGYYRTLVDKDLPKWQKKANYKAVAKLAGAIVLSESLKVNFTGILPDEKIFVVPNCVDDEFLISDAEFEEKLRTLPERKIKHILYLSNFIRAKGYREVLELARLEKERCENGNDKKFHFDFAGKFFEETEEQYFFGFIKENALQDYVTYHGIVGGDKKRELLKQSDIFVLLSRNEGQPISILEAMGNGMTVVTTNVGGIPDIVKDKINGFITDINGMVKCVDAVLISIDYSFMKKTALLNRETIIQNNGKNLYVESIAKCFRI